ncbi:MAG TPA: hypothetical protein VFX49_11865 [Chloroflexota bacterium]|nr:hypothetical protein [Chloroflexota bacterium]
MMGKAHTAVLVRAAEAARGHYGDLLLRQRHWIDRGAAGRFNDGVLRDWHYKKTPQTVWCLRRLTRTVLDTPAADESRTAFLLHWISHYFVDAIWTCHVAQRYMKHASSLEQKEFDNGIEREVEAIVETDPAFDVPPLDGRGYWTLFWQGRLESDRRSHALLTAWDRKDGYLPISLESVPYCTASFAAYLVYLNHLRDDPSPAGPSAASADSWVIALDKALERGRPVETPHAGHTADSSGWQIDRQLDQSGAAFGTGEPRLDAWPGEWVLAQSYTGDALAAAVFTPEFAERIAAMRGYDRSIEQDQAEGRSPTPFAIQDRDRQQRIMHDWLARWDHAAGLNAPANPPATP